MNTLIVLQKLSGRRAPKIRLELRVRIKTTRNPHAGVFRTGAQRGEQDSHLIHGRHNNSFNPTALSLPFISSMFCGAGCALHARRGFI
jgi:hypothetical protein